MKTSKIGFRRGLEITTNLAIIVLAVVVIGKLVWSNRKPTQPPLAPPVDSQLSLAGVSWEKNGSTLLVVLQKGCRYCEESAPFYRRLYEQRAQKSQPRIVAVLPGEKAESLHYLLDQEVTVDEVINSSLSEIKVSATPALLLVDRFGQVKNVWVGKLNQDAESAVLQQLLGS